MSRCCAAALGTWNFWRAQNPHITPNLIGITLSVAERQVGPINGGPINLAEARLRHASLRFATLTNADLTGADLSDTDLREARLIVRQPLGRQSLSGAGRPSRFCRRLSCRRQSLRHQPAQGPQHNPRADRRGRRRPSHPPAAAVEPTPGLDRKRLPRHEWTAAARHSRSDADQEQGSCAADQRREGIMACRRPALERSPRAPDFACARSARGLAPGVGAHKAAN